MTAVGEIKGTGNNKHKPVIASGATEAKRIKPEFKLNPNASVFEYPQPQQDSLLYALEAIQKNDVINATRYLNAIVFEKLSVDEKVCFYTRLAWVNLKQGQNHLAKFNLGCAQSALANASKAKRESLSEEYQQVHNLYSNQCQELNKHALHLMGTKKTAEAFPILLKLPGTRELRNECRKHVRKDWKKLKKHYLQQIEKLKKEGRHFAVGELYRLLINSAINYRFRDRFSRELAQYNAQVSNQAGRGLDEAKAPAVSSLTGTNCFWVKQQLLQTGEQRETGNYQQQQSFTPNVALQRSTDLAQTPVDVVPKHTITYVHNASPETPLISQESIDRIFPFQQVERRHSI